MHVSRFQNRKLMEIFGQKFLSRFYDCKIQVQSDSLDLVSTYLIYGTTDILEL